MVQAILSCDRLLQRDHQTELLEIFLSLYPKAPIYTLAHRPKAIPGPVERRFIKSTFLSHLCPHHRWSFLAPGATKGLSIPESADLVINISGGLSHGFPKGRRTRQLTYLYDLDPRRLGGWFFSPLPNPMGLEISKAE